MVVISLAVGCRYSHYEAGLASVRGLLENWDRQTGEVRLKKPPAPPPPAETEGGKTSVTVTPKKKSRKVPVCI